MFNICYRGSIGCILFAIGGPHNVWYSTGPQLKEVDNRINSNFHSIYMSILFKMCRPVKNVNRHSKSVLEAVYRYSVVLCRVKRFTL